MRRDPDARAVVRRRLPVTLLSVGAGLVCLSLQLSTALHMVLVEHVRCAEHGELVHAGDGHDGHASSHEDPASDEPGVTAADHAAHDGHEHCPNCSERRRSLLNGSALAELVPPSLGRAPAQNERTVSHGGARVFLFAPKTSPPA